MGWAVSWGFKNVLGGYRVALFTTVYSQTTVKRSTVLYAMRFTRDQVLGNK